MKKYYQILGLKENTSLEEVEEKYQILIKEFDPDKQSDDDLKKFFKTEQTKVKEAYQEISSYLINREKEKVLSNEFDLNDFNNILICYKTLKSREDATLAEINSKYNLLLDELNPDHQSDALRDFFENEQKKVKEAYDKIVEHLSKKEVVKEQFNKSSSEPPENSISKPSISKKIIKNGEVRRMFSAPFSFKGRIRRLEYFLSLLIFSTYCFLVTLLIDELRLYDDWYLLFYVPSFWFIGSQGAKRFQDCWMSGWVQLIPYVNFFLIIFVIFKNGTIGDNKYGSNPKGLNYSYE